MDWFQKAKEKFFNSQTPYGFWVQVADSINPYNPAIHYGLINEHLECNTYLQGHELSIEDFYLAAKLTKCPTWCKIIMSKTRPFHLTRWFMHVFSIFPDDNYEVYKRRSSRIDGRLVEAIDNNNMSIFEILLDLVDINARSPVEGGPRPIHAAALKANKQALQRLLEKGADIETQDEEGLTPIFYAAQSKSTETLIFLMEKGANIFHVEKQGRSLFYWASSLGNVEMLKILLDKGLDPNKVTKLGRTALSKSAWNGNIEVISFLLTIPGIMLDVHDKRGRTALHNAVWGCAGGREGRKMGQNAYDSPECAKLLLDKGCYIEASDGGGNTPLCIACSTYAPKSLELLLSYGADKYHTNNEGYNPYHQALARGNYACAEIVIKSGFDIHSKNGIETPMMISIKYSECESIEWLASQGVLPDLDDMKFAVKYANGEMLEKLMKYTSIKGLEDFMIKEGTLDCAMWIIKNLPTSKSLVIEALKKEKKLGEAALAKWSGEITIEMLECMLDKRIDTQKFLHRAVPTGRILRLAIKEGNLPLATKLIQDNPSLIQDSDTFSGNTALHIACISGMSDIVPKLISSVPDPVSYIAQVNSKGLTSITLAQLNKRLYIAEMLKDMIIQSQGSMSLSQVKGLEYEEIQEELTPHPYTEENMPLGYWPCINTIKPINETRYMWVDTCEGIDEVMKEIESFTVIGVDLEYHTFEAKKGCICLIQLSNGEVDYVIDALVNREKLGVFVRWLMENEKIVKIFHGCDSDLLWLKSDFDAHPVRIFDTARAYRVLKNESQLSSLAFLIHHFFGIKVDKSFHVAEWRIRPLPGPMVDYARIDAHYLPTLFNNLLSLLDESQQLTLSTQCNAMCLKPTKNKLIRLKILEQS